MESPFPLPDELIGQYLAYLADAQLNRYPSASAEELQQTLRQLMGIPENFGVLLGNGSDELIQLLALACQADDAILSVEPSFVMYQMIAKSTHLNYQGVDLDENNELFEFLKQKGVLIKNLANAPKLTDYLRVTVESSEQNVQFMNIIEAFYG